MNVIKETYCFRQSFRRISTEHLKNLKTWSSRFFVFKGCSFFLYDLPNMLYVAVNHAFQKYGVGVR